MLRKKQIIASRFIPTESTTQTQNKSHDNLLAELLFISERRVAVHYPVFCENGCHSFMPHPCRNITDNETIASRLIERYYHVPDFGLLPRYQHDFYLVSVRDPYDRAISAFVYQHVANRMARNETMPTKEFYKMQAAYVCFPTLQVFCEYLQGHDSTKFHYPYHRSEIHPYPCRDFARAAFHGRVRLFHHLYFGYQRIQSLIPQQQPLTVYVARQERLLQDWDEMNRHLTDKHSLSHPATPTRAVSRKNMTVWETARDSYTECCQHSITLSSARV